MKFFKKTIVIASVLAAMSTSVYAHTYIVEPGDTLAKIAKKLGVKTYQEAGITSVPSGDLNKIYVGDEIHYTFKAKKKKKFRQKKREVNLDKFCFQNNRSIHYKVEEQCKPKRFEAKEKIVNKKGTHYYKY